MAVPEFYLNGKHTSTEVYAAVYQLNQSSLRVSDRCVELVEDAENRWFGYEMSAGLRRVMSEDFLPRIVKKGWHRDENRVKELIRSDLRVATRPETIEDGALEKLHRIDELRSKYEAMVFWRNAQARIKFLTSESAFDRLGLRGLALYNFVESRIIGNALNGVYLTKKEV